MRPRGERRLPSFFEGLPSLVLLPALADVKADSVPVRGLTHAASLAQPACPRGETRYFPTEAPSLQFPAIERGTHLAAPTLRRSCVLPLEAAKAARWSLGDSGVGVRLGYFSFSKRRPRIDSIEPAAAGVRLQCKAAFLRSSQFSVVSHQFRPEACAADN
jgi:hypothetical protein